MVDVSFLEQKAKDLAKRTAGAIMAARLNTERSEVKRNASRKIEAARAGKAAALKSLDTQAQKGMKGKAGKALSQRAGVIQATTYHHDGVESVS
ncbi:hypothetical protein G7067_12525 [Leucobacter insecticola]|uniref:Uncharacterized protein n=1 Tax=Leucobacter insecticola TaxID=2714934 RepID=A0A6G8FLT1_9MICO|nr:hypothetical protein [Leucobacter insecticola]QIM17042.1 hypothetical protein G7067_12525 [Leucobacter insecticola]